MTLMMFFFGPLLTPLHYYVDLSDVVLNGKVVAVGDTTMTLQVNECLKGEQWKGEVRIHLGTTLSMNSDHFLGEEVMVFLESKDSVFYIFHMVQGPETEMREYSEFVSRYMSVKGEEDSIKRKELYLELIVQAIESPYTRADGQMMLNNGYLPRDEVHIIPSFKLSQIERLKDLVVQSDTIDDDNLFLIEYIAPYCFMDFIDWSSKQCSLLLVEEEGRDGFFQVRSLLRVIHHCYPENDEMNRIMKEMQRQTRKRKLNLSRVQELTQEFLFEYKRVCSS